MGFSVVCVDLGGVMVRIRHSWPEICAAAGLDSTLGEPLGRIATYKPIADYQSSSLSEADYLAKLAHDLGGTSIEQALAAHNAILDRDYDGAAEWVSEVQAGGTKVYCLSNTNELHYRAFFSGRFPVCEAFDHLLSSHIVGANKPEPAIYRAMEDLAGAQGSEIVFFDDHPPNVEGARAMGWQAHQIDPMGDPVGQIRAILG